MEKSEQLPEIDEQLRCEENLIVIKVLVFDNFKSMKASTQEWNT